MTDFAKIAATTAGILALAVLAMAVGLGSIWDALLGLVICVESNAACPWE
jgi:hypothetical protein